MKIGLSHFSLSVFKIINFLSLIECSFGNGMVCLTIDRSYSI